MPKEYPIKPQAPVAYTGQASATTTNQTSQYKFLLGTQAAGAEVGLFYQLNQAASDTLDQVADTTNSTIRGGLTPLEANSAYA